MPNSLTLKYALLFLALTLLMGCQRASSSKAAEPPERTDIKLISFEAATQQLSFQSSDSTRLAGQIDWPRNQTRPPLVFIIHHSGPVDRDSYQYLAARLVPAGYAVFRFDKRGNGQSSGVYGCCEANDALAAYRAVITNGGFDPERVFIVAQSIGSQILADHFVEFARIHRPTAVFLLSNLVENEKILAIKAPLHIVVSDSEPNLAAIAAGAVQAHRAAYDDGASFYVAPHTEHTLFDISEGPIDWSDPNWPNKFSNDAWLRLLNGLKEF